MKSLPQWPQNREEIVGRIRNYSTLKIVTKTLDEPAMIEDWIEHHAHIVGYENLIIADNGSTNAEVLDLYSSYLDRVCIFQFQGNHNMIHVGKEFAPLFQAIRQSARYAAIFDSDERLVRLSNDRWVRDGSILTWLESLTYNAIIPTVWLPNCFESYIDFALTNLVEFPDFSGPNSLDGNLLYGKPLLPSELFGIQDGIHNLQFRGFPFNTSSCSGLFLLHLYNFPSQRIEANRKKLHSRGLIDRHASVEQILAQTFPVHDDVTQDVSGFVEQIRKMHACLNGVEPPPQHDTYLTLKEDGSLVFSTENARRNLKRFFISFCEVAEHAFRDLCSLQTAMLAYQPDSKKLYKLALAFFTNGQIKAADAYLRKIALLYPDSCVDASSRMSRDFGPALIGPPTPALGYLPTPAGASRAILYAPNQPKINHVGTRELYQKITSFSVHGSHSVVEFREDAGVLLHPAPRACVEIDVSLSVELRNAIFVLYIRELPSNALNSAGVATSGVRLRCGALVTPRFLVDCHAVVAFRIPPSEKSTNLTVTVDNYAASYFNWLFLAVLDESSSASDFTADRLFRRLSV